MRKVPQDDNRADRQADGAPRSMRDRASSAGKSASVSARKASGRLFEAVGGLANKAIDRVLLTNERISSAAEGKQILAGEADREALAGDIQRVVVLAVPVARRLARGARFTKVPWLMVASSAVSIGIGVRTGVRELQVLASLVAQRLEQATGVPSDPALVKKLAIDLYLDPKRTPELPDDRLRPRSTHAQVGVEWSLRPKDIEARREGPRSRRATRRSRAFRALGRGASAPGRLPNKRTRPPMKPRPAPYEPPAGLRPKAVHGIRKEVPGLALEPRREHLARALAVNRGTVLGEEAEPNRRRSRP
jgi:hypothetical protein